MTTAPTRWLGRVLLLVAALLAPLAVIATAPEAHGLPCAGSVEEARRHMDKGLSLFDKKRYQEAAAEFDAAYTAQPFSAFVCNAAQAYYEAGDYQNAISRYKEFLRVEPNPKDLVKIKTLLAWLEGRRAAEIAAQAQAAAAAADAGAGDAGAGDAGAPAIAADADAGAGAAPPPPPPDVNQIFRSQVIVQSDPPDAPLRIWARRTGAPPFQSGKENPGWEKVVSGVKTPHDVSLGHGDYHIEIDAFKDYKKSETDISLVPGHLYEFKANLSQGEFLGFLQVTSPVEGAKIYLDDPPPHRKGPWGRCPHGALVDTGPHDVWIEAPGYVPHLDSIVVKHGETIVLSPQLTRVDYGFLVVDGNAEEVTVRVDGVPYGVYTPVGEPLRIKLPAGRHKLELSASGRKTFSGDVDVPRGQELPVHGRLSFTPPRATALISGVLGAGAIVGGVVLIQQPTHTFAGVDTQGKPSVVSNPGQPWFKIGGFASLGVGVLLGGATVYTLVSDPTPDSRAQVDKAKELDDAIRPDGVPRPGRRIFGVTPTFGDRSAGVIVSGTF